MVSGQLFQSDLFICATLLMLFLFVLCFELAIFTGLYRSSKKKSMIFLVIVLAGNIYSLIAIFINYSIYLGISLLLIFILMITLAIYSVKKSKGPGLKVKSDMK